MTGVHEAIAAVLDELPAIGKNQRAPAGMGGYSFRGIDDVINAINVLLGKHGCWFAPTVHERIDGSFANKSGNLTWTVKLRVGYSFFHKGGTAITDMAVVWGEAHDTGDKGTQKALTAAEKAMLVQVFAISTQEQAESDSERHEAMLADADQELEDLRGAITEYLRGLSEDELVLYRAWCKSVGQTVVVAKMTPEQLAATDRWLSDRIVEEQLQRTAGKSVPKGVGPSTEGVKDVKTDGTLV